MANWLNLDGKVAIVTGGASGIGYHVATTLKEAGATPVIADVTVNTGDEKDGIFCVKCDVTSKESVEASPVIFVLVDNLCAFDQIFKLFTLQTQPVQCADRGFRVFFDTLLQIRILCQSV